MGEEVRGNRVFDTDLLDTDLLDTDLLDTDLLDTDLPVLVDALKELPGFGLGNDFLVTVESALGQDSFKDRQRFRDIGVVDANHTTTANPATGLTILNEIRKADPVR